MEKSCTTCRYKSKSAFSEPCHTCIITKCSENAVGIVYTKWESAHYCSTCKHCDKKITEEPCLDCDIRMRNDKWEGKDETDVYSINNMSVSDIIHWCATHPDPEIKKQFEEELAKYNKLKEDAND